jgi:NAD(P) transhydrogenase subunit alpha
MDPSIALLTIFILAIFTGYEVVSKVSTTLHTPLMSGANAIHGIILVGAVIVTGQAESTFTLVLGLIAIVLATLNLVGGFVVTDRMLEMFKSPARGGAAEAMSGTGRASGRSRGGAADGAAGTGRASGRSR